jgi:hypothetical protein
MMSASLPPLPPGTPMRQRISLLLVQFLVEHRGIENLMCFFAVWWGTWTLLFPDFWGAWAPTVALAEQTGGHPEILSIALFVNGVIGYAAGKFQWNMRARAVPSLIRFMCWAFMAKVFIFMEPIATPGVACYSAFALAELMAYVNHVVGFDYSIPPLNYQRRKTDVQ